MNKHTRNLCVKRQFASDSISECVCTQCKSDVNCIETNHVRRFQEVKFGVIPLLECNAYDQIKVDVCALRKARGKSTTLNFIAFLCVCISIKFVAISC